MAHMRAGGPTPEQDVPGPASGAFQVGSGGAPRSDSPPAAGEPTVASRADERVQLAAAESARVEGNLTWLLRGLDHLRSGATAAQEANAQLGKELEELRVMLARSHARELFLERRVRSLEDQLTRAERQYVLHREALFAEEDLFLAELLTDHQRELRALHGELEAARARHRASLDADEAATPMLAPVARVPHATPESQGTRVVPLPRPTSSQTLARLRPVPAAPPAPATSGETSTERKLEPPRPASRRPLAPRASLTPRTIGEYSLRAGDVAEERLGAPPRGPDRPRS